MKKCLLNLIVASALLIAPMHAMSAEQMSEVPKRGQSMDQVRASFGEPKMVKDAVGKPPITRWVYDGYCVYFEHNLVITSVIVQ